MKLLDITFDMPSITDTRKEIMLRYHSLLAMMDTPVQEGFIAVHGSSDQGPAIARIAFLAKVDLNGFMVFAKYVVKIATDLVADLDTGKMVVGSKQQTIATASSVMAYAKIMHDQYLAAAAHHEFEMDMILDYASTLFCFLHLYRCCFKPDEVIDTYDESFLNDWFNACDVPVVQTIRAKEICLH